MKTVRSPEHAKFCQTHFFGSLDGLRALSIVGVIWFHCWYGTPYYAQFLGLPLLRQGSFGVNVFFVISGFLITTLLLRERERYGSISIRSFYVRRALRIWPLYYLVLGIYVLLVSRFEGGTRAVSFFHYLPSFATYTYTWFLSPRWPGGIFNLSWTLCTEEQFYAVWPVILRFFRGAWSSAILVGVIAVRLGMGFGWTHRILPPDSFLGRVVQSTAIPICLGALLAQALHNERTFRWLCGVLGRKWSAPAAAVLLGFCLAPANMDYLAATVATTALVGACAIREDNALAPILKVRPVAYLGVLSYGMYLLNSLSIQAAHRTLSRAGSSHPLLVFPVALALTSVLAFFSYRFFESRFLLLKTRFSRTGMISQKKPIHEIKGWGMGTVVQP